VPRHPGQGTTAAAVPPLLAARGTRSPPRHRKLF